MNQFRRTSGEAAIDPKAAIQAARQMLRMAEAEGKKAAVSYCQNPWEGIALWHVAHAASNRVPAIPGPDEQVDS